MARCIEQWLVLAEKFPRLLAADSFANALLLAEWFELTSSDGHCTFTFAEALLLMAQRHLYEMSYGYKFSTTEIETAILEQVVRTLKVRKSW